MITFREFFLEQKYYGTSASGGIIVSEKTKRILFLKRSADEDSEQLQWEMCVGGSKDEDDLDALATFHREAFEEIGMTQDMILNAGMIELFFDTGDDGKPFKYHVFHVSVKNEFDPVLSHEHTDFKWVDISDKTDIPLPLHFGTERLLKNPKVLDIIKR